MKKPNYKIKNYTTLEKIWLIPVLTYVFLLLMLLIIDGSVGFYTILFDLDQWNHAILNLFNSKWSAKLLIIMILYNLLMLFITLITNKIKDEKENYFK